MSARDEFGSSLKYVEANVICIYALYEQVVRLLKESSKIYLCGMSGIEIVPCEVCI
jgi:hypothetical protein